MNGLEFARSIRLAVFVLAALALALIGAVAGSTKQADAATYYTVEVSFEYVRFWQLDDGSTTTAVYGTLVGGTSGGDSERRNLARWGTVAANCSAGGIDWFNDPVVVNNQGQVVDWGDGTAGGPCFRRVGTVGNYYFGETLLCDGATYNTCAGPWERSNHKLLLVVKAGEKIGATVHLKDYDETSADDDVCKVSKTVGPFTDAQLASLNMSTSMSQGFNGDGSCKVAFTLKRVG